MKWDNIKTQFSSSSIGHRQCVPQLLQASPTIELGSRFRRPLLHQVIGPLLLNLQLTLPTDAPRAAAIGERRPITPAALLLMPRYSVQLVFPKNTAGGLHDVSGKQSTILMIQTWASDRAARLGKLDHPCAQPQLLSRLHKHYASGSGSPALKSQQVAGVMLFANGWSQTSVDTMPGTHAPLILFMIRMTKARTLLLYRSLLGRGQRSVSWQWAFLSPLAQVVAVDAVSFEVAFE